VNPIVPSLPEAHAQNATVMRAVARAAAYNQDGYGVVIDGVIGPWYLDVFRTEVERTGARLHYVVLRADSREAPVREEIIRSMHPQFARLGALENHAVDTSSKTIALVLAELLEAMRANRFVLAAGVRLGWTQVAG
jgi:hypothetical protein